MDKEQREDWVVMMLDNESFEDLLERFDITPEEAFERLFQAGLIDEELMK